MSDPINPDHYKRLPVEAIDIIESAIANAPSNEDAFLHGQVLRYILRCWNKNGIEDLKKAKWYLDRLIDSFTAEPNLTDGLVAAWEPKDGKANQVYPEPKWTPKIGDWVKITEPCKSDSPYYWTHGMDAYIGKTIQVKETAKRCVIEDYFVFDFDWLEPAEAPKATTKTTLNSDTIPEGYRKLNDSSEEPRQPGDLRWSIAEKRYIPISGDEIVYANRDNWAACRKITEEVTGQATGEVTGEVKPPDGWRWLEVGAVIRKGDQGFENGLWYSIEPTMIGMALQSHWRPILRRNKFKVGEKVVYTIDNTVWTFKSEIDDGPRFPKSAWVTRNSGVSQRTCVNNLAPYIEEAK